MTTRLLAFALASLVPAAAAAQHFHHHIAPAPGGVSVCKKAYTPPTAIDGSLPKVDWNVKTENASARQYFQQGMTLYYGFNYEGALRNFKKATDLDGSFLMGWWGRALAAGPNINFVDPDDDCLFAAQAWADRAWGLAQKRLPTDLEYQLAKAMLLRYSDDDKVQTDKYAQAMGEIWTTVEKDVHPEIGALYAESLMNKWPWDLWTPDHREKHIPDTHIVLTVLRAVTAKYPLAVGANHYLIHAVEAGPNPAEAEKSADFLRNNAGNAGHLRHMPSHTYLLKGQYAVAVQDNDEATKVDRALFAEPCGGTYKQYIESPGCLQLYYGHYHAHDLFFRSVAESFIGKIGDSMTHARETRAHVESFVANEPGLQRYMAAPYFVLAGWGYWQVIIDTENEPPPPDCYKQVASTPANGCHILRSMWHWAKGMAYTSNRPPNIAMARQKLGDLDNELKLIKPPGPTHWGNNEALDVLRVADLTLQARIAWAERRYDDAIKNLVEAVAKEDALVYDEPPQWLFPVRQSLGGAYLAMGRNDDAAKTFEADLVKHRENGRSLYGAYQAHLRLHHTAQAEDYRLRYETAWHDADKLVNPLYEEALWLLGMPRPPGVEGAPASGR